jgi:glutaminyl-peptide cyclotransferase
MKKNFIFLLVIVFALASFNSCNKKHKKKPPRYQYQQETQVSQIKELKLHIIRQIPHNGNKRYIQGFEFYKGILYESTGEYKFSSIKKIDPKTGKILLSKDLNPYFAEGLTILNGNMFLLSYKEGIAHVFNPENFAEKSNSFTYEDEGWGLTNDGKSLIMSNGSEKIYYRNPITFNIEKEITVTYNGNPIEYINELEYVDGKIYANIYGIGKIIVINAASGVVESEIDASELDCSQLPQTDREAVLNGIAYNLDSKTFYITGKRCPNIYEVTFDEK